MAENIDFQKIIDDLSYSQENFPTQPDFVLNSNALLALNLNDSDDSLILRHILQSENFVQAESRWTKFQRSIAESDQEFGKFVNDVRAGLNAPGTFITDYIENRNSGISSVAEFSFEKTFFNVISFSSIKPIKVIDNGLGKNLVWCRILFEINNGTETKIQYGYCLRKDIVKLVDNSKQLITVENSIINSDMYARSIGNNVIATAAPINKVTLSEETAAYFISKELNISSFAGLTEAEIKEEFRKAFSQGIKDILSDQNRQNTDNGRNFEDKYYCFARVDNYYISSRPSEKVLIIVSIPIRNILSVTSVQNIALDALNTAADVLVNLPDLVSRIDNINVFDFNELAPNISSALQGGPNAGDQFDYVDAVSQALEGSPATKEYISPQEIETLQTKRIVVLPFEDTEVLKGIVDKCLDVLGNYYIKINQELDKNEDTQVFIDLSTYSSNFLTFYNSVLDLRKKNITALAATPEKKSLQLGFENTALTSMVMIDATGKESQLLAGTRNIIENDPLTDITFSFLLCNIIALSKEDKSASISSFLSKYITPGDLAQIKFAQGTASNFVESNKQCLQDYKSRTINQLKTNSNEFLNNIVSGETIKNAKETFSKKEWQITLDNLKAITDDRVDSFIDLKTLNWDAIIEELIACIADAETRELVRFLLEALKNWLLNDIPLACQIPPLPIPKFPVIRLPTFPHLPTLVTSYYSEFGSAMVQARTDIIVTLIRSLTNLSEKCRNNIDPDRIGDTDAEQDLLNQSLQQGLEQEGALDASQDNSEEFGEIRRILSRVSQSLTKEELLTLFLGTPNTTTLKITKSVINDLEQEQNPIKIVPKKLGVKAPENNFTTLADSKVIFFFSRFTSSIKPSALTQFQEVEFSDDPDILCIDQKTLNENLKKALLEKGLSEEAAQKEIDRKNEEIRKTIAELGVALTALNSEVIKLPPLNCQTNPDGSITPGISDKVGAFPDAFAQATSKTLDALLKPIDENYNSDIVDWITNCTETSASSEQVKNLFLEYPKKVFSDSLLSKVSSDYAFSNNLALTTNKVSINYQLNDYVYASDEFRKYFDYVPLSKISVQSNNISSSNTIYNIQVNNGNILTSSYSNLIIQSNSKILNLEESLSEEEINLINSNRSWFNTGSVKSSDQAPFKLNGENYNIVETNFILSALQKNLWEDLFKKINNLYVRQFAKSFIFDILPDSTAKSQYSRFFSINFNPILTPKEKKCKEKDLRLLNLEDIKKIMQENAAKNACIDPKVDANGKIIDSPVNRANFESAAITLLRIYAIDFNLKLLPLNSLMTMLKADSFYFTCYNLIIKDIEKIFGPTFKDRILKILLEKYLLENNIKNYNIEQEFSSEINKFNAFSRYFRKEFLEIAKKVYPLYEKTIKNKKLSKQNFSIQELKIYENKYENYLDYLYDNIFVADIESLKNRISSIQKELEIEINFKNSLYLSFADIFENAKFNEVLAEDTLLKIKNEIYNIDKETIYEILKFLLEKSIILPGSTSPAGVDKTTVSVQSRIELFKEINGKDILKEIERIQKIIKEKSLLLFSFLTEEINLNNRLLGEPYFIDSSNNNIKFKLSPKKATLENLTDCIDLYNFGKIENKFDYKKDEQFKKVFYEYFSTYYPIEEMISSYSTIILSSLTSIDKINNSFNSTKQQVKNMFSIIDLASDYTKEPEDTGLTFLTSQLKVIPQVTKSFTKTFAQTTDLNIGISSAISLAYKAGVAAAENAGVSIPAKNLPLYIPSGILASALLPPITPQGFAAVAISVSDETFEITTGTTNEDDKCPEEK
jgi:hypothetical protein